MKFKNLKKTNVIYLQNLIILLRSAGFIISNILFLLFNLIFPIIFSHLYINKISDSIAETKNYLYIFYVINILLISTIIIYSTYALLYKQKNNGMHNLELRFGIKIYKIYFIRVAIIIFVITVILIMSLFLNMLIFITIKQIPTIILWDKILSSFGFLFLFAYLMFSVSLLLFALFKQTVSTIFSMLFVTFVAISPIISMISYSRVANNYSDLLIQRKEQKGAAKIKLGIDFLEFIRKNPEYIFLIEAYNDMASQNVNSNFSNAVVYKMITEGNLIQKYVEYNKDDFWKSRSILKLEKLQEEINNVSKSYNLSFDESIFNNQNNNKPLFKQEWKLSSYNQFLISKNISNGKYNNLFEYIKKIGDNILIANDVSREFAKGANSFGGELVSFEHFGSQQFSIYELEKNDYNPNRGYYYNAMVLEEFWILLSILRYSQSLDKDMTLLIQKGYKNLEKQKWDMLFNPMTHFDLMYVGKSYTNPFIDNIWSLSQSILTSYPNSYWTFSQTDKIKTKDPYNAEYRLKSVSIDGEINYLNLKYHNVIYIELLFIIYYMLSIIIGYFSFVIYKKRLVQ